MSEASAATPTEKDGASYERIATISRPATADTPPRAQIGAEISGLGVALPPTVVTNAEVAARLGIEEEWIVQRTGVRERRLAAPGETLAAWAAKAGAEALAAAGAEAADLDLVLVATVTNDQLTPSAAPQVAAELGATRAGAFDIGAACSGFVAALSVATGQIEAGRAENVLVIGADLMSRVVDPEDRSTAVVFGDGAGAIVLRACERGRIGPFVLGADGANGDLIVATRADPIVRMQGHETFRHAVERMSEITVSATAAAGHELADIDLFVYHQANARILQAIETRLELPGERIVDCIHRYGNTTAATIPLTLEEARLAGDLKPGSKVLVAAFGAGLTWGATVIEWGSEDA
jgi:3-oxoacyl-[acyl-carrier-protein] synthase-3